MLAIHPQTGEIDRVNMPEADSILRSTVSLLTLEQDEQLLLPVHGSVHQYLFDDCTHAKLVDDPDFDDSFLAELGASIEDAELDLAHLSLSHIKARTALHLQTQQVTKMPTTTGAVPPLMRTFLGFKDKRRFHTAHLPPRPQHVDGEGSFFQYAIVTWTLHTRSLSPTSATWALFKAIAMERTESWKVHPWPAYPRSPTSHLQGLFGFAVVQNHLPLLQLMVDNSNLLEKNIYDLGLPGNDQLPALHLAARFNFVELIPLLLRVCNVNAAFTDQQRTALHIAAIYGHHEVASLLCKQPRIKIDLGDTDGHTPLYFAAKCGHRTIVDELLATGQVDISRKVTSCLALCAAASGGHSEIVRVLLDAGADVNTYGESSGFPLYVAARGGHDKVIRVLLDAGAKVDVYGDHHTTALVAAALGGHEKVVRMLLDADADVNTVHYSHGNTNLLSAANEGHDKIMQVLSEGSGLAARRGFERVVRILLVPAADHDNEAVKELMRTLLDARNDDAPEDDCSDD